LILAAPRGRQLSHKLCGLIKDQHEAQLRERFQALVVQGQSELLDEGIEVDAITTEFSLDLLIDTVATSYVAAGWTASRNRSGCVFLDRY
jgi:hypothetical protein